MMIVLVNNFILKLLEKYRIAKATSWTKVYLLLTLYDCCCAKRALKDIKSDYWKALVLSLITAGGVIQLEEV